MIFEKPGAGYTLRETVKTVAEGRFMLNVGSAAGVQSGMKFRGFQELAADKKARPAYRPACPLTIASVSGGLESGNRAEQIVS
jgi:hypothetical protein